MRLEKISDSFISAYMSKDDLTNLGLTADGAASAADIIIGAAVSEFGFSYRSNECEVTAEPGAVVTVRAKIRHTQSKRRSSALITAKRFLTRAFFCRTKALFQAGC